MYDGSRRSQVLAGVILRSNKERLFVDALGMAAVAERFKSLEELKGLAPFRRLITVAIQWVETEIGKLSDLLRGQYKGKQMPDLQGLEPPRLSVPTQDEMHVKRY